MRIIQSFLLLFCFGYVVAQDPSVNNITKDTTNFNGLIISVSSEFLTNENDEQIAKLYSGLVEIGPNRSKWKTKIVDENDVSLSNIIRNEYRYYDTGAGFHSTYGVIEAAIMSANNMPDANKLSVGDTLALPFLPVKSKYEQSSKDSLIQFFSFQKDTVYSAIVTDNIWTQQVAGFHYTNFEEALATAKIAAWIPQYEDAERLNKVFSTIGIDSKVKNFFISEPAKNPNELEILQIEFDGDGSCLSDEVLQEASIEVSSQTLKLISEIPPWAIQEYHIIDSFPESNLTCSHGDNVYAVVNFILSSLDAVNFSDKVRKVSLDFFENRQASLDRLQELYKLKGEKFRAEKDLEYKLLRTVTKGNCQKFCIPFSYLKNLLELSLIKKPEVISMSFRYQPLRPILGYYADERTETSMLAAVENYKSSIENYIRYGNMGDLKKEPMYTFYNNMNTIGTMLVGGETSDGGYDCFYSTTGSKVSAIGKGVWTFNDTCTPQTYGSSFATPQIATYLWIMKAYYRSLNKALTPREAMIRTILCSNLNAGHVGSFASGGIPNLDKMLAGEKGFFVKQQEVKALRKLLSTQDVNISYVGLDSKPRFRNLGAGIDYISGLAILEDGFYIFQEALMRWEKLPQMDSIKLNIKFESEDGEIIEVNSIEDLKKEQITQIVTLTNDYENTN